MANGSFLLWIKNVLKINTVPGYTADYDKTRGDSVFIDNSNRVMEVNNLQEGLTPTIYNGLKASVLDGSSQYWQLALPNDIASFNPANTNGDWTLYGSPTVTSNITTELGSSRCIKIDALSGNGISKYVGLVIGKKYKLVIRYKSNVEIKLGNTVSSTRYGQFSATSEWNTITKVITVVEDLWLRLATSATGIFYLDTFTIKEDQGLDANEDKERILHSKNAESERTLGAELWTNTTFTDTNADGLANGFEFYSVPSTETLSIGTDSDGLHQKIIGAGDTRILVKPTALDSTKSYLFTFSYKSNNTFRVWIGGGTTLLTLPTSAIKKTVSIQIYMSGLVSSGIWIEINANTLQFYSLSIREIPNLISGTMESDTWGKTRNWVYDGTNKKYSVTPSDGVQNLTNSYYFIVGKRYRFSILCLDYVAGSFTVQLGGSPYLNVGTVSANGIFTFDGTITGSSIILLQASADAQLSVDNVHISEIPEWSPSFAPVSGNNHYCDISTLDKASGTQSQKITASGAGRGVELITVQADREFSSDTGFWTKIIGVTISDGLLNINRVGGSYQLIKKSALITNGKYYDITLTISNYVSGSIFAVTDAQVRTSTSVSGNGTFILTLYSDGTEFRLGTNAGFVGSIDNISVKEVLGEITLPTANIEPLVAGKKYTLEGKARLDPASLVYANTYTSDFSSTEDGFVTISERDVLTPNVDGVEGEDNVLKCVSNASPSFHTINKTLGSNLLTTKVYKINFKYYIPTGMEGISIYGYLNGGSIGTSVIVKGSWQDYVAYYRPTSNTTDFRIYVNSITSASQELYIKNITIQEATPVTITQQIGTKSVNSGALSIVQNSFTKFVMNFEATASEVNADWKSYLSGQGAVFVDGLSLTQAYDMWVTMKKKSASATNIMDINSYEGHGFILRDTSFLVRDSVTALTINSGITSTLNIWESISGLYDRTNYLVSLKNNVEGTRNTSYNTMGKMIVNMHFRIGWNNGTSNRSQGQIGIIQIIRFDNISKTNFNPNTYQPGDAITDNGGGVPEVVLWQDWSNIVGAIAMDKYRPETTRRNDLTAYGSPLASTNIVTVKDFSPQVKKLRQGTHSKQPIYSSVEGFDFDGTDDILEAGSSLGSIKTVVLKLKADNIELGQDILQLSAGAKLVLNIDGTITATGFTSPTIKIQNTLLADAVITANNDFLVCVKTATAITADAFKLGGSTTYFNGKIRRIAFFTTELDDPTIQKIFKSIRSI